MKEYDFIIIGAGPTGLVLTWYLQKLSPLVRILLVEREASIGGCHRVRRVGNEMLFTEHGPRIYIENYVNFKLWLRDILTVQDPFNKFFTPYKFNQSNVLSFLKGLELNELLTLAGSFLYFLLNPHYGAKTTMEEYLERNSFSKTSQEYVNRLCMLTDGGEIDRYTLYEFMEILNQNAFYKIFQPRIANDRLLWPAIQQKLLQSGQVDLFLNTTVIKILNKKIEKVSGIALDNGQIIKGHNVIAAIPPGALLPILESSGPQVKRAFGPWSRFKRWVEYTSYEVYIPIMFWFPKTKLETIWGIPSSDWGIASIILSEYLEDLTSEGTVISTCISLPDERSRSTGLSANQTLNKEDLITETFRQLSEIYRGKLPHYNRAIVSPGVYYDKESCAWRTRDKAYFRTILGPMSESKIPNFACVGIQNEKANYAFTSLEGAVENAINFLKEKHPVSVKSVSPQNILTVRQVILLFLLGLLLCVLMFNIKTICGIFAKQFNNVQHYTQLLPLSK